MKLTIETSDAKEALFILTNLVEGDSTIKAAAPVVTVNKEEAEKNDHTTDEVSKKRSEASKRAAETKKKKAEEAKKAAEKVEEAEETEEDPLGGLSEGEQENEYTIEDVQSALAKAIKTNKENKEPVKDWFKENKITGGVTGIPKELYGSAIELAESLM